MKLLKTISIALIFLTLNSCSSLFIWLGGGEDKIYDKIEYKKKSDWPPKMKYPKNSLGDRLQDQFASHAKLCGFNYGDDRDYIPTDIVDFTRKDLNIQVESKDIQGNSLLFYVFLDTERSLKFDNEFVLTPDKTLALNLVDEFNITSRADFPSFLMTKSCSGFMKAAIDGSIEPPVAAIKAAVKGEVEKESAVIAAEGWFVSPIYEVLTKNNYLTTSTLFYLWDFYINNKSYDSKAYYLKQFQGLMIGRTASKKEYLSLETSGKLNVSSPIAKLDANLEFGKSISNEFKGRDWQTIIYSDYKGNYTRESRFEELPTYDDILTYFNNIKPKPQFIEGLEQMAEGRRHSHYFEIRGIPSEFANDNSWSLTNLSSGVYKNDEVTIEVQPTENDNGCRFVVSGIPKDEFFTGNTALSSTNISYKIVTNRKMKDKEPIQLNFASNFETSNHPIPSYNKEKNPWKLDDNGYGKFKISWIIQVLFQDNESPVDYSINNIIAVINPKLVLNNDELPITASMSLNSQGRYEIVINTINEYSYEESDLSVEPIQATFEGEINIPLSGGGKSSKPIRFKVNFPAKKEKIQEIVLIGDNNQ